MDRSGNPWIVYPGDVPGDGYIELAANWVFADQIVWTNYTDANHVVDVKDGADREVFFKQGVADLSDVTANLTGFGGRIRGLRVYTLDSGQLLIYVR